MTGFVYIIGAGCGSADLITVRGMNALKKCDTVVYDALIDTELLTYTSDGAEIIPVGKRSGAHAAKQEDINALLVEKALAGRTVARLKGGDPFVFGRGGEEITELQKHGIPFSVIPGISSCIAVPELAGIPVTHRNMSREFYVITAHTADGERDFSRYANLDGTLVFLMGLNALPEISAGLMHGGVSPATPAAVISEGGTAQQKAVRGTLADIAEKAAGMPAPAVIAVGGTAAFDFSCSKRQGALSGISVTVTGTERFTEKLAGLLEADGADVKRYSHLQIVRKQEIPALDGYSCIAFTSSYGAEMFVEHCKEKRIDLRSLAGMKIAAVGRGTAGTLADAGIIPDIIPDKFTVADLAGAISDSTQGKVLILRAALGSEQLAELLTKRNVSFDDVKIYDTVCRPGIPAERAETDYIVFGSSSGVKHYFDGGSTLSVKTKTVCIGAQTAESAKKYTDSEIITADPHTAQGAAAAIKGDRK